MTSNVVMFEGWLASLKCAPLALHIPEAEPRASSLPRLGLLSPHQQSEDLRRKSTQGGLYEALIMVGLFTGTFEWFCGM